MDKTTELRAYAKLNLALDITGTDGEGYHLLDMINCTVGVFDTLAVSRAAKVAVTMDGKPCGGENTAYRAASAVERLSGAPLAVDIVKGIPFGAGLGGSSADASAVLRYAADAGLISLADAEEAARSIGSDVVYMMHGGMARVCGRGELIEPLRQSELDIVIARRDTGGSTAEVYRKYDEIGRQGAGIDGVLRGETARYNVLEAPAVALCPGIARLKERMAGAFGEAVMTGSGSAVCSIVADADNARRTLERGFCDANYRAVVKTVPRAIEYL